MSRVGGAVAAALILAVAPAHALELSQLPGWAGEDHLAALKAFRQTCLLVRGPGLQDVCRRARTLTALDGPAARLFLEASFTADPQTTPGVLTGYFSPTYTARRVPDAEFSAPLRPKPADLVAGAAYADRTAIEARPPEGALAWLRPEELFFLQVQGSGVLAFPDGKRMKAVYAANNGRPFVALANPMRERGLLSPDQMSAEGVRAWLAAHRGPEADAIMRLNPRYAFFRLAPDDGRAPSGSAGVHLPAGRAVAVDAGAHAFGELLWLDADRPLIAGAKPTYRRLVTALDTGGAIKGPARADLYVGEGDAAGLEAGRIHHQLRLYRLVPR